MKDIRELVLCDWHSDRVQVHVTASLTDGVLTVSGQDLGSYVEEFWGDSEYEYGYTMDRDNTKKLFTVIHGETDPEEALLREFGGEGGCRKLRELCDKNRIAYDFYSV